MILLPLRQKNTKALGVMTNKLYYNESIRIHLESIAKLDEMVGPIELVVGWYDDWYFPCQNDKDLYNEGVWERGQKEWKECFSQIELTALAKFHVVFDQVWELLSEDPRAFSDDPNWKKLQLAAVQALQEMGAHNDT
jgi:hypothetical protein